MSATPRNRTPPSRIGIPTPAMYARLARKILGGGPPPPPAPPRRRPRPAPRRRGRRKKRRRPRAGPPWKSCGLALFRGARAPGDPRRRAVEVLLVRHRCSYAFSDFVYGHFSGRPGAADLFRGMSRGERILAAGAAASGDHGDVWAQLLIDDPAAAAVNARRWAAAWGRGRESAAAARKRFARQCGRQRAPPQAAPPQAAPPQAAPPQAAPPRWGLPKGRPRPGEPEVAAAFRELREETRVGRAAAVLVSAAGARRVSTEAVAKNRGAPLRRYLDVYRAAVAVGPVATGPTPAGDLAQRSEIMETRWVSVEWAGAGAGAGAGAEAEAETKAETSCELDRLCPPDVARAVRELAEATAASASPLLWTSLSLAHDLVD